MSVTVRLARKVEGQVGMVFDDATVASMIGQRVTMDWHGPEVATITSARVDEVGDLMAVVEFDTPEAEALIVDAPSGVHYSIQAGLGRKPSTEGEV